MVNHSGTGERASRRAAYVKWSIFGVFLPLLPLVARALAAWLAHSTQELSFIRLFSDGELLVVATVIAAAVIGDLLFDISGRNEVRSHLTIAVLCAIALLVVVVSVLMFGLVTLDNQNRSEAVQQAQRDQVTRVEQSAQLIAQSSQAKKQALSYQQQAQELSSQLTAAKSNYQKEVVGTGGSPPGNGPLATALRHQVLSLQGQSTAARNQADRLSNQALALRQKADQLLEASLTSLSIGRQQAAIMSVIMFVISCITGAYALWYSTKQEQKA